MSPAIDLAAMTEAEKDALILSLLPLVQQLKDALAEIAVLKVRINELARRPKTPDNSSTPPSKAPKPDRSVQEELRRRRSRPGVARAPAWPAPRRGPRSGMARALAWPALWHGPRPGMARALAENPDRVVDAHLDACPGCQAVFPVATQTPQSVYDRIELPPGRRRDRLRDSTLVQCRYDLERRLDRIVAHAVPQSREGEKLRRRIGRSREHLTVFVADRDVPPTKNVSERALRPGVVFRKVTNGFRAKWGAETYAAFRSVVSTAKANGRTVLAAVQDALRGNQRTKPG